MKAIVWIFGVLVGIWLVLVAIGFMLPGHYRLERSLVIDAPAREVYAHVGDFREWRGWGVWFQRDPDMKVEYSPATDEVGAWTSWVSKSQGDGRMTIESTHAPDAFRYRLEFPSMRMVAHGAVLLAPAAGGTRVTMTMEGDLGRSPVYRWFGLFMDRLVGPDFEAGLANLKRVCEARPR